MRYQFLAFVLFSCGFPALILPFSGWAQESRAPDSQQEAFVEEAETDSEEVGSERSESRGPLALTGNEAAAEWILPTHRSIIDLAATAQEKAQSAEVRSFAETLHAEQTEFVNQINASLKEEAERRRQAREQRRERRERRTDDRGERRGDPDPESAEEEDEEERRVVLDRLGRRAERIIARAENALGDVVDDAATRASRRLRVAVRGFPWIQTQQETAKNALTMAQEDLESRQSFEFDQVYLGYASAQHVQAIAELRAVESEVSEETKELIETTLPKLQRHREMASQLMRRISQVSADGR